MPMVRPLRGGVGDDISLVGYCASKAGVLGLTRELAGRWGRRGIRVNAIAPGFFPSRMADALRVAATGGPDTPFWTDVQRSLVPLRASRVLQESPGHGCAAHRQEAQR